MDPMATKITIFFSYAVALRPYSFCSRWQSKLLELYSMMIPNTANCKAGNNCCSLKQNKKKVFFILGCGLWVWLDGS